MQDNPNPVTLHPMQSVPPIVKKLIIPIIILILVAVLVVSSVYTVNAGTESVITRFDKLTHIESSPGLHWKIPFIDKRYSVNMEAVNRMEFGFRSEQPNMVLVNEATMLTSDECLVVADWVVLFQIKNSYNYLFKVEDVEGTLRIISESSYRRVVASHILDDILTNQKDVIQNEVKDNIQAISDLYELGIVITACQLQDAQPPDAVNAAFLDVTSAREEKNSKINQAMKYENEKLPTARGQATQIINDAEGYRTQRINEALGSVARYNSIEAEYAAQPEIMKIRMYLEMIQAVLPGVNEVYFVDPNGSTMQFLPLLKDSPAAMEVLG
jgi:membrane protease subunit HflK